MAKLWPARSSDPVYADQVRSSYANLPLTLCISVLNAFLLAFVLTSDSFASSTLVWIGLVAALSVARLALWHAHRRTDVGPEHNWYWSYLAVLGSFASGVLWGCGTFVAFSFQESQQLFFALVIAGMCAGAATVHAAYFPSVAAFIVPAILPLMAAFLIQGTRLSIVSAVMTGIFGGSLCVASLKFKRWFYETTSARLSVARRTMELNEANIQLQAEITRRRSTEDKLQQAQKLEAIGRLTAGIAHDFNNLLMAIGGSAGLISGRLAANSEHAPRIATIIQSVERGATLTRQLLAFGRKQTLTPQFVDINDVLHGLENLLETTLGGHASLMLPVNQKPAVAFVDVTQLEHAILNLVINARDAMPNGGTVNIKVSNVTLHGIDTEVGGLTGDFVMISVSDTGTGMSESVRQRAFEPFFTTKGLRSGSGLGLSQVYGVVQQSGGGTEIHSQVGRGTTVNIYLPKGATHALSSQIAVQSPLISEPPGLTGPTSQPRRRVMLLDDDDQARDTLAEILETAGYTALSFATAKAALDEVRAGLQIDLMIVDFAMPDMRGDQFAIEVRSLLPAIPILFITGYAEPEALQSEPWLLTKPFSSASLVSILEDAIRNSP